MGKHIFFVKLAKFRRHFSKNNWSDVVFEKKSAKTLKICYLHLLRCFVCCCTSLISLFSLAINVSEIQNLLKMDE